MVKNKKPPTSSIQEQTRIMQAACKEIKPPPHILLDNQDLIFFDNVIAEFAKSEWTDHQLEIAGMLARTMSDLDNEQRALRREGFISVRENGTTVENPRSRVVKSLTGDILSLRRSLALHARARGGSGNPDDIAKARSDAKDLEAGFNPLTQSLIAKPQYH